MHYRQPYANDPELHGETVDHRDFELEHEDGMVVAWIVAAIAFYLVIVVAWAGARAIGLI